MGLGCVAGAVGFALCVFTHHCMCGHLAHGQAGEVIPLLVDGLWLLGFLVAGVVGLRGGFPGGRLTGLVALNLVIGSVVLPEFAPAGVFVAIPLGLVGLLHMRGARKKSRGAEDRLDDGGESSDELVADVLAGKR